MAYNILLIRNSLSEIQKPLMEKLQKNDLLQKKIKNKFFDNKQ